MKLLPILLAMALAACATPGKAPPPRTVLLAPPVERLEPTPKPIKPSPLTFEGWVWLSNAYDAAVDSCNADKADTLDWVNQRKQSDE
jgi:hypothetical protein